MTDSERDPDPAPEDEAPPADGPLTPEEATDDPAYDPDDETLKNIKGG
jgi:hypothetical protein